MAKEQGYLAALNTRLTPELVQEGKARDVIRLVQNARKNAGFEVSDYIALGLEANGDLQDVLEAHGDAIQSEVLARELRLKPVPAASYTEQVTVEEVYHSLSACARLLPDTVYKLQHIEHIGRSRQAHEDPRTSARSTPARAFSRISSM